MDQLTQVLKDGKMEIQEVPFPALKPGCVLVRNHYSIISAGTESKTVKDARKGYIGKAMSRKDEVKKVLVAVQKFGFSDTYRMVKGKLEAPGPLGYSCAGEVMALANDVTEFKVGDLVACGGVTASHAEVVAVPKNLCAKVSTGGDMRNAAFATIGAISMQGIRQVDPKLGDNVVVIGLGLVGQLTVQLLLANGVNVLGIDIDQRQVDLAKKTTGVAAYNRNDADLDKIILDFSEGHGADAVIIAASTGSLDPVNFAGDISRKKGQVVIVGAVPTGFDRKRYYKKELELKMSASYGPGRYDANYEDKGIDYPIGYVRWTEQRNMTAFVKLCEKGLINPSKLVTHEFEFEKAPDAYDVILGGNEAYSGISLKYDTSKELSKKVVGNTEAKATEELVFGVIGAGSFATNFMLPALQGNGKMKGLVTGTPSKAKHYADKFGFEFSSGDAADLFNDNEINTIFIATRHDSHADYVIKALEAGKNVFVEKPLCLKPEELDQVAEAYKKGGGQLVVGFNRRMAPNTLEMKKSLGSDLPMAINMRINAGTVPPEHWVHDKEVGGGRIIGEGCHFIDLCGAIVQSPLVSISASAMGGEPALMDSASISLQYENGSIASLSYFSNGNYRVPKELIEVFTGTQTAVIDDFKLLTVYGNSVKKSKLSSQDKGHKAFIQEFCHKLKEGKTMEPSFEQVYESTLATFKAVESMKQGGERLLLKD